MKKVGVLIIGAGCAVLWFQTRPPIAALYDCLRRDNKAALEPCAKAAEKGHASGKDSVKKKRDGAADLMTLDQIADAQRPARESMERHPKAD